MLSHKHKWFDRWKSTIFNQDTYVQIQWTKFLGFITMPMPSLFKAKKTKIRKTDKQKKAFWFFLLSFFFSFISFIHWSNRTLVFCAKIFFHHFFQGTSMLLILNRLRWQKSLFILQFFLFRTKNIWNVDRVIYFKICVRIMFTSNKLRSCKKVFR